MNDLLATETAGQFDVEKIRADFPCLQQEIHGHPLVFLDSAASAQKPNQVIEAQADVLRHSYANIHRGVYTLSERATDLHDGAREKVRTFLNGPDKREIVFTRNVTETINLVAQSFVRPNAKEGDEVLITGMEHHANIVPWQMLAEQAGTKLVVAPITDEGELILEDFDRLITSRTRLVSVTWVANALGTINPIKEMIEMAHAKGVPVYVDAAQAVQHMPVDVQALDCDFLGFTGHKLYGPSGIGVLYGKAEHLEAMPPYQGGGDMILSVGYDKTEYNDIPYKFEAGTVAIEAAAALGAAIDYVTAVGLADIGAHEEALLAYATRAIQQVPGLRLVGTAPNKAAVLSFVMENAHPHDIGTLLDLDGVAVRTGHHCAQPVLERLGHNATARASIGMYNTEADIDALVKSLNRVASMFG
ncbi:MAG: SufS family cysteine desulfurase [Geminicoccaceae bacterium]